MHLLYNQLFLYYLYPHGSASAKFVTIFFFSTSDSLKLQGRGISHTHTWLWCCRDLNMRPLVCKSRPFSTDLLVKYGENLNIRLFGSHNEMRICNAIKEWNWGENRVLVENLRHQGYLGLFKYKWCETFYRGQTELMKKKGMHVIST